MRLRRRDKVLLIAAVIWCLLATAVFLWHSRERGQSAADDGNYQPYKVTTTVGPHGEVDSSYFHNGLVCTTGPAPQTSTCTNGE